MVHSIAVCLAESLETLEMHGLVETQDVWTVVYLLAMVS